MKKEKILVNGKVFVVNFGSSSFKFQLLEMPSEKLIVKGNVERIGIKDSCWKYTIFGNSENECDIQVSSSESCYLENHMEAAKVILDSLFENGVIKDKNEIVAIGHRILHGGEDYKNSDIITDETFKNIVRLKKLGPLHQPAQIQGIECMSEVFPGVPQIAAFDTAFHQTIPEKNFMYGVPIEWYKELGVRVYGFHGTSVNYASRRCIELLEPLGIHPKKIIVCHLGNGASLTAVEDGKSLNTTMGFTPLDGLMMGTRSGTIDPAIIQYVHEQLGMSYDEIFETLNKGSGLFGITGMSDFRDVKKSAKEGNKLCQLALEMFKQRIIDFISTYNTQLKGQVDAIIFTGGIGENDDELRAEIISAMSCVMDVELIEDENKNIAGYKEKKEGIISTNNSATKVLVIPANEELMIACDSYNLINGIDLGVITKPKMEDYTLSLIAFYISKYIGLYNEVREENEELYDADASVILKKMREKDSQLNDDFISDLNLLRSVCKREMYEKIIANRTAIIDNRLSNKVKVKVR